MLLLAPAVPPFEFPTAASRCGGGGGAMLLLAPGVPPFEFPTAPSRCGGGGDATLVLAFATPRSELPGRLTPQASLWPRGWPAGWPPQPGGGGVGVIPCCCCSDCCCCCCSSARLPANCLTAAAASSRNRLRVAASSGQMLEATQSAQRRLSGLFSICFLENCTFVARQAEHFGTSAGSSRHRVRHSMMRGVGLSAVSRVSVCASASSRTRSRHTDTWLCSCTLHMHAHAPVRNFFYDGSVRPVHALVASACTVSRPDGPVHSPCVPAS